MSHKIALIRVKNNTAYVNMQFDGHDAFDIEISDDYDSFWNSINKENRKIPKSIENIFFEQLYISTMRLIKDEKRCACGSESKEIMSCCFCGIKVCDNCYIVHETTFELYCDGCTSVCEECGKVVFDSEGSICPSCTEREREMTY